MEDAMVLKSPVEEEKNSIVVKEKKGTVAKLWKGAVKTGVSIEKLKLKAAPFVLKVVSIFAPECAPVCLAIEKFLKSDAGKKYMEVADRNFDALESGLTGDFEGAKNHIEENLDSLSGGEGETLINGIKDTVDEVKGMSL